MDAGQFSLLLECLFSKTIKNVPFKNIKTWQPLIKRKTMS